MHDRSRDATGANGGNGFAGDYSPFHYESDGVADDSEADHVEDPTDAPEEHAHAERGGFAGTCKTGLIDWIQLVQMGRRDAVLGVRTDDGKQGTLWCRDGDIVDADCDGIVGEDAVYRALSWKSGRVSVEFDAVVTRHRLIETATAGLLLRAAYRRDSGIHELADLSGSSGGGADTPAPFDDIYDKTEVRAPSDLPMFDEPRLEPHAGDRYGLSPRFVLAGGLSVVLLFFAIAWRWINPADPAHPSVERAVSAVPNDVAAARRVSRPSVGPSSPPSSPSSSGRLSASERQRPDERSWVTAVRSNPAPRPAPPPARKAAPPPPQPTASNSAPARHRATMALARRPTAAPASLSIPRPFEAPRAPAPARMKVDIIDGSVEAAQPRVQIIREGDGRAQPRVQIIEDRKPRIDTVE